MKSAPRSRRVLHVDLDPFFVSVERALDPSLRERPVIVGGDADSLGCVAAASAEARACGVAPGQPLGAARLRCPDGVFRPGDFEAYAGVSEEVTTLLLAASRRVERPSVDEAYVDLTPEAPGAASPVSAAERLKDELQRRLGLDAALGLGSSRIAARVASAWARPRGLLVVLPGYEASFIGRAPLSLLPHLPPHIEEALEHAGLKTLGDVATADPEALAAIVGPAAARLQEAAHGRGEEPIAVATPPSWIQEEARIRARNPDRAALLSVVEGLARRAFRRLRPFDLAAGQLSLEVRRADTTLRRSEEVRPGLADEATGSSVATTLADPLLTPPSGVRSIQLRLTRLTPVGDQAPLFPGLGIAR